MSDGKTERIEAIVAMVGAETILSDEMLSTAFKPEYIIRQEMRHMYDRWGLMFRKHIPFVELANERYPEDWWQAVRARWLPRWWLRRHPVRYREVRLKLAVNKAFPLHEGHRFVYSVNNMLVPDTDA